MGMFAKLNLKWNYPVYTVIDRVRTFTGKDGDGNEYGTYYDIIWSPDRDLYFSVIPKRYWNDFHLTLISVNHELPPHVDSNIKSTINFYFETKNCKTTFYKTKTDNPNGYWMTNQTDGHCYYLDDLEEVASFTAKPMEAYLLDIKQVHGVTGPEKLSNDNMRKAITIGSLKHDFETVLNMLLETRSVDYVV